MLKKTVFLSIMVCLFISASSIQASSRSSNNIGISLDLAGHPHPALLAYNLSWHPFDRLRIGAGMGSLSKSGTTFVGGLPTAYKLTVATKGIHSLLFLFDSNFTPFVGAGYSIVSVTADVEALSEKLSGLSLGDYKFSYFSVGIDWVTDGGFNISLGYNKSSRSEVPGLPYISLGLYFF